LITPENQATCPLWVFVHKQAKSLPHNGEFAKKLHCEFVMAALHETGSPSMLNKVANRAYEASAD